MIAWLDGVGVMKAKMKNKLERVTQNRKVKKDEIKSYTLNGSAFQMMHRCHEL